MKLGVFEKALLTNICTGLTVIIGLEIHGIRLGAELSILYGILGQIGWGIVFGKLNNRHKDGKI